VNSKLQVKAGAGLRQAVVAVFPANQPKGENCGARPIES
jgi:hypothetical protein